MLHAFHPKKRFGQNFLIEKNIVLKILKAISLTKEDIVLEIGSGKGILTKGLVSQVKKVIAVELDTSLFIGLKIELKDSKNIELVNKDILELDLEALLKSLRINQKITIVGNIPYNITSPILEFIFKNIKLVNNAFLMVQREFAERLVAELNTKDYSSLTCFTQFHSNPVLLFPVKRTCFRPEPKVDSYFIKIEPKKADYWSGDLEPKDKALLFKIIRAAFCQRRKSISNSLSKLLDKQRLNKALSELKINSSLRAENLSIGDFIRISNEFGMMGQF
jgi:16S rRNA (adenine1518-N6/adenine1519-N6)-dimethyltransferase